MATDRRTTTILLMGGPRDGESFSAPAGMSFPSQFRWSPSPRKGGAEEAIPPGHGWIYRDSGGVKDDGARVYYYLGKGAG